MAPALLDLGGGEGELDAGKEDEDVITTALLPVNLGIPLGAAV
jgi:hypothetical protein